MGKWRADPVEKLDHWTEQDHRLVASCKSILDLSQVGISLLRELAGKGAVSQLCGPMSTGGLGSRVENLSLFSQAIKVAREHGLLVFNQLPFQGALHQLTAHLLAEEKAVSILEGFWRPLFEAQIIKTAYFLPAWETSRGALWERELVTALPRIQIKEFSKKWYEEALRRHEESFLAPTKRA
jgi:hypothetical protein